ncbi:MAG: PTS fructose transporter subunit IIA [Burkholderiaceae bacterium]|jgi:PTS system ascorbate-specific IIA component|nr:PTS fructose transporter subunit IIA [Burkholderiaceae bacterium]
MTNAVLIIAHAPLAHALRRCALHVFPDAAAEIAAVDVHPDAPPDKTLAVARLALARLNRPSTLVLTDVFGATPSNVALRLVDGRRTLLVAGANLPMLLRALTYRREPLAEQAALALAGGTQGIVMPVPVAVAVQPQNLQPPAQPTRAVLENGVR